MTYDLDNQEMKKANRPIIMRTVALTGGLLGFLVVITVWWLPVPEIAHANQDPDYRTPLYVILVPDRLDFTNQVVGTTSRSKRITVKNNGGKPLIIDSVDLTGDNPNSFAVVKDTCTGATVDPQRACIVDVNFTAGRTGTRRARLRLNDNAADSPQRMRLKGNGIYAHNVPPF